MSCFKDAGILPGQLSASLASAMWQLEQRCLGETPDILNPVCDEIWSEPVRLEPKVRLDFHPQLPLTGISVSCDKFPSFLT